jgi:beta-fructofuranosidase
MLYRPSGNRTLWDTWLFEWDDKYHLFFLESRQSHNDYVGHAVSTNLIDWDEKPSIYTTGAPDKWNYRRTATGMVVRHDDEFYMFVGGYDPEVKAGDVQVIGIYVSHDLDNWREFSGNPVSFPCVPYSTKPEQGFFNIVDWRDPFIIWNEKDKCFHAYLCARMPGSNQANYGSAVAHLKSCDLQTWEALPPIAVLKHFPNMEVPEIFEIDGLYYLTFSSNSLTGLKINTANRENVRGTFYMVSEYPDGPFRLPEDPLLIGAGNRKLGAYVARSIESKNGRILYHQTGDLQITSPAWGIPKRIKKRFDGTLFLEYMPVVEELEIKIITESFASCVYGKSRGLGNWTKCADKLSVEDLTAGSSCQIAEEIRDFHFQCRVCSNSAAFCGILFRIKDDNLAVALMLDFENQRIQIGKGIVPEIYNSALALFGWECDIHESCRIKLEEEKSYHLRCIARSEFIEIYLDNVWVFTSCMPELNHCGNIACYIERGNAEFTDLRLSSIKALAN